MLLTPGDWLTLAGLALGMLAQSFGLWKWLSREFEKRDRFVQDQIAERTRQFTLIRSEVTRVRELGRNDITRLDREMAAFNREVSVRLAAIPTRDAMENMLLVRVGPVESGLRTLVIELARQGLDVRKNNNNHEYPG